jgi:O-acetylhomoserine (thiol)-lyase
VIDYGTVEVSGTRMKNEMLFNFGAYITPQVAYMQNLGSRRGRALRRA